MQFGMRPGRAEKDLGVGVFLLLTPVVIDTSSIVFILYDVSVNIRLKGNSSYELTMLTNTAAMDASYQHPRGAGLKLHYSVQE